MFAPPSATARRASDTSGPDRRLHQQPTTDGRHAAHLVQPRLGQRRVQGRRIHRAELAASEQRTAGRDRGCRRIGPVHQRGHLFGNARWAARACGRVAALSASASSSARLLNVEHLEVGEQYKERSLVDDKNITRLLRAALICGHRGCRRAPGRPARQALMAAASRARRTSAPKWCTGDWPGVSVLLAGIGGPSLLHVACCRRPVDPAFAIVHNLRRARGLSYAPLLQTPLNPINPSEWLCGSGALDPRR